MNKYFYTENLFVGYNGKALIKEINVELERGKILTLIGPNGAGKSTILKSITRHLTPIGGKTFIDNKELSDWGAKEFAQNTAVVLTDRISPELMTCAEVVAMGRYPYTGMFGKLTDEDKEIVVKSLKRVHAMDIAEQDFSTLSDGQRQRIMLARAICQQPEIIVLDEPTAFLDIRHKIELLDILRSMARDENITVIMSLHEIDLAMKVSDFLLCVKGDKIAAFGKPEEILSDKTVESLYSMDKGSFDVLFGSVELAKPKGAPKAFVVAGGGYGIDCFRALQRQNIPFSTGVLFENDVDCHVAKDLSDCVITNPAFEPILEAKFNEAAEILKQCSFVIDAGTPVGTLNEFNGKLLELAKKENIPIKKFKKGMEV